jgi:hypothetical protein
MNRDFTVIFSYNLNGYSFLNIRTLINPFLKILLKRVQQIQKKTENNLLFESTKKEI